jgi:hypothetical protein
VTRCHSPPRACLIYLKTNTPTRPWRKVTRTAWTSARWACSLLVLALYLYLKHCILIYPDEIEFPPPKPAVKDILGGAGTYSAIGARIFSPPPWSQSVGWIVDCGSDFPLELRETIAQWDTGCLMRETPHRLTTRGWNGYGENDFRGTAQHIKPQLAVARLIFCSLPVHDTQAPTRSHLS